MELSVHTTPARILTFTWSKVKRKNYACSRGDSSDIKTPSNRSLGLHGQRLCLQVGRSSHQGKIVESIRDDKFKVNLAKGMDDIIEQNQVMDALNMGE